MVGDLEYCTVPAILLLFMHLAVANYLSAIIYCCMWLSVQVSGVISDYLLTCSFLCLGCNLGEEKARHCTECGQNKWQQQGMYILHIGTKV